MRCVALHGDSRRSAPPTHFEVAGITTPFRRVLFDTPAIRRALDTEETTMTAIGTHPRFRGRLGIAAAAFTIAVTTAACGSQEGPVTDVDTIAPAAPPAISQGRAAIHVPTSADAAERDAAAADPTPDRIHLRRSRP
jgi:hypothetical protein